MNKPLPIKSSFYNWTDITKYLAEKYPSEWESDEVWSLLCDKIQFMNDSWVQIWDYVFEQDDIDWDNPGELTEVQRWGQILWEEFGERSETGELYNEPIVVGMFW